MIVKDKPGQHQGRETITRAKKPRRRVGHAAPSSPDSTALIPGTAFRKPQGFWLVGQSLSRAKPLSPALMSLRPAYRRHRGVEVTDDIILLDRYNRRISPPEYATTPLDQQDQMRSQE